MSDNQKLPHLNCWQSKLQLCGNKHHVGIQFECLSKKKKEPNHEVTSQMCMPLVKELLLEFPSEEASHAKGSIAVADVELVAANRLVDVSI